MARTQTESKRETEQTGRVWKGWKCGIPLLAGLAGCALNAPPAPPKPLEVRVALPIDSAWSRTIRFLADQRLTVSVAEKPAGLISVKAANLSWAQFRAWANCGNSGGRTVQSMDDNELRAKNVQASADVSVLVVGSSSESTVTPTVGINATWTNPMMGVQAAKWECVSNGVLEETLASAVRR